MDSVFHSYLLLPCDMNITIIKVKEKELSDLCWCPHRDWRVALYTTGILCWLRSAPSQAMPSCCWPRRSKLSPNMNQAIKSVEVWLREKIHSKRSRTKRSSWNGLELGKDKIYAYMRSQRSPEVVVKSSLSKQWQLTLQTGQHFPCPKSRTIQWSLSKHLKKGLLCTVMVHCVFLHIKLGKGPLMYKWQKYHC